MIDTSHIINKMKLLVMVIFLAVRNHGFSHYCKPEVHYIRLFLFLQ